MCTVSMRAAGFSADKTCRLSCSGLSACAGGVRCRSTAAAACAAASAVACVAVCRHCANSASDPRSPSTSNSSQTTCAGGQAAAKRIYRTEDSESSEERRSHTAAPAHCQQAAGRHLSNGGLGAGRGGVEDVEQQRRAILAVVMQQLRHRQPRDVCHLQPT